MQDKSQFYLIKKSPVTQLVFCFFFIFLSYNKSVTYLLMLFNDHCVNSS